MPVKERNDEVHRGVYRDAETKPFETRAATLRYDQYTTTTPYNFDIEQEAAGGNAQKEMEEIARKFQSGNLSDAEMTKLMARMEKVQQELHGVREDGLAEYVRQQEQKKQQFGCEDMYLKVTGTQVDGWPAVQREGGPRDQAHWHYQAPRPLGDRRAVDRTIRI